MYESFDDLKEIEDESTDKMIEAASQIEMNKIEQESKEKQRKKVNKLTNRITLKPSMAKIEMMKKLRHKKESMRKTSSKNPAADIVHEEDGRFGGNYMTQEFNVMST